MRAALLSSEKKHPRACCLWNEDALPGPELKERARPANAIDY